AEFVGGTPPQRGVRLGGKQRRPYSVERDEAGKETVEPGALLRREWSGFGDQMRVGLREGLRHATRSRVPSRKGEASLRADGLGSEEGIVIRPLSLRTWLSARLLHGAWRRREMFRCPRDAPDRPSGRVR